MPEEYMRNLAVIFLALTFAAPLLVAQPPANEKLEANRKHLKKSLAEAKKGKLIKVNLDKL